MLIDKSLWLAEGRWDRCHIWLLDILHWVSWWLLDNLLLLLLPWVTHSLTSWHNICFPSLLLWKLSENILTLLLDVSVEVIIFPFFSPSSTLIPRATKSEKPAYTLLVILSYNIGFIFNPWTNLGTLSRQVVVELVRLPPSTSVHIPWKTCCLSRTWWAIASYPEPYPCYICSVEWNHQISLGNNEFYFDLGSDTT